MSLLGIDVGTTGCKAAAFSLTGEQIAVAYEEYDHLHDSPGWAELDSQAVWDKVKSVIARVAAETAHDPVSALSVSSLGEAFVPVSEDRGPLARSILNFDVRGEEFLPQLGEALDPRRLYAVNGNTLGNHYGLTKLMWTKKHTPEVYADADKMLLWGAFVSFMLGADPVVDYSLANRTLLFDIERGGWCDEFIAAAGLDKDKLPATAPSGTVIGQVSDAMAAELGLPKGVAVVTGAHDQCANAVGCGAIEEGRAMLGMGTYICLVPVFSTRGDADIMMARGLNTEHHAMPGKLVSFIYNQGGCLLKWYRDTFAAADHKAAQEAGRDVYPELLAELPDGPSGVTVLPHFTTTGPPEFIANSSGVMAGLRLETPRGEVLKGILESTVYYLRACVETLPSTGVTIDDIRAVGGGSKSNAWLQLAADILNRPFTRPRVTEAGALGAAILAGAATGVFGSVGEGVEAMVHADQEFTPDPAMHARYAEPYERYTKLWPAIKPWMTT